MRMASDESIKLDRTDKQKVLFLCFHNSAKSQMAEGLLRASHGDRYDIYSAGVKATEVDHRAVKVMREIGIDISHQRSKSWEELRGILFDLAITVCDKARELCPICGTVLQPNSKVPASKKTMHKNFEDPATASGSEEDQFDTFRRTRDEIKIWIAQTFG